MKERPVVLVFSAEDRAIIQKLNFLRYPDLASYQQEIGSFDHLMSLCAKRATRIDGKVSEIVQNASTRLLALEGIGGCDDICWKLLLPRLENKEVSSLSEVAHVAYLALDPPRKMKQMRKVWMHLPSLIEEYAEKATEEELIDVLKDCLVLNARDMNFYMVQIVVNSLDPEKIIEQIKDFRSGFTTFDGVITGARRQLDEEVQSYQD